MKPLFFVLLLLFAGCARKGDDPLVAQMRLRTMQTRTFVGYSAQEVTKEVVATLQDEGYMIKNVSNDLGLLTAELDINIEKLASKLSAIIFRGKRARWKKHTLIEMTSNVTEVEGKTKARINFLVRVYDNLGRIVDVHQILDEQAYTSFFTKIQKGLITSQ